jgi:hypothetical protein
MSVPDSVPESVRVPESVPESVRMPMPTFPAAMSPAIAAAMTPAVSTTLPLGMGGDARKAAFGEVRDHRQGAQRQRQNRRGRTQDQLVAHFGPPFALDDFAVIMNHRRRSLRCHFPSGGPSGKST